ncbi:hypothetical protein FVE85_0164 [Porphyridium purpureum]|uniref:Uncharacterized protein n=1 Tax=Porphyridium purpureum TaxID=35688 RepID=A0A5J4YZ91_PORPP|nr:hypothetical protein FVE85_0164 [Porphyridium purpureum]|eukprot:POR5856..scf208_2
MRADSPAKRVARWKRARGPAATVAAGVFVFVALLLLLRLGWGVSTALFALRRMLAQPQWSDMYLLGRFGGRVQALWVPKSVQLLEPSILEMPGALTQASLSEKPTQETQNDRVLVTMIVLCHKEFNSLLAASVTWLENGLISYVDRIILFQNEAPSSLFFDDDEGSSLRLLPRQLQDKMLLLKHPKNALIGQAISWAVAFAQTELILFVEKDFQLVESATRTVQRLDAAKRFLVDGRADIVRFRHRYQPGHPNYASMMYEGREAFILAEQSDLLCYAHHWLPRPDQHFPQHMITQCAVPRAEPPPLEQPGSEPDPDPELYFCAPAKFCQWTNNPSMFRRSWFLRTMALPYMKAWNSSSSDFESWANSAQLKWATLNVTVALGGGLFSHVELKESRFDERWYVWRRDFAEVQGLKDEFGYVIDPRGLTPLTMRSPQAGYVSLKHPKDRAPEWLRQLAPYAWTERNAKPILDQTDEIQRKFAQVKLESKIGQLLYIHGRWVVDTLLAYEAPMPQDSNITIVTILDEQTIGGVDGGLDAFLQKWRLLSYPKVLYVSSHLKARMSGFGEGSCDGASHACELIDYDPGLERTMAFRFEDVRSVIQQLEDSQGIDKRALNTHTRLHLLARTARQNPFSTTHFVFVDASYPCLYKEPSALLAPSSDAMLRNHMFRRFFSLSARRRVSMRVDGKAKAMLFRDLDVRQSRGGVMQTQMFGADAVILNMISWLAEIVLAEYLLNGFTLPLDGTLSAVRGRMIRHHPHVDIFHPFCESHACPASSASTDRSCDHRVESSQCVFVRWMASLAS